MTPFGCCGTYTHVAYYASPTAYTTVYRMPMNPVRDWRQVAVLMPKEWRWYHAFARKLVLTILARSADIPMLVLRRQRVSLTQRARHKRRLYLQRLRSAA